MARRSREQLAEFMRDVLHWLGQPRWQVHVLSERDHEEGDVEDDDVWAETNYNLNRYAVTLWVSDHVLNDLPEARQRQVMVHEALHSVHSGIDALLWLPLGELLHDHEHESIFKMYHRERELMVDQLSMSIMDVPEIKRLWRARAAS